MRNPTRGEARPILAKIREHERLQKQHALLGAQIDVEISELREICCDDMSDIPIDATIDTETGNWCLIAGKDPSGKVKLEPLIKDKETPLVTTEGIIADDKT